MIRPLLTPVSVYEELTFGQVNLLLGLAARGGLEGCVMMNWFSARQENAPVIMDHGYLQRLAKHIGERETRELLADGILDLIDRLARLRRFGDDGDLKNVADLVHEIAGAAGHLGLTAISHAAFQAARTIREDTDPDLSHMVDLILQHQDASMTALAAFCSPTSQDKGSGTNCEN